MFDAQDMPASVATDVSGATQLPAGTSQPIHLLDRLNAVFKHRRLAGTAFVLVIAMMMLQTYSTIPTFQPPAVRPVSFAASRIVASSGTSL